MTIDATISKADLAKCAEHYGKLNSEQFQNHGAGTVIYKTFIGEMDLDTRQLVGAHHFEVVKFSADTARLSFKFSTLPGVKKCP